MHSLAAATWGNFPWSLALLHLFVIGNGLILYTDWGPTPTAMPGLGIGLAHSWDCDVPVFQGVKVWDLEVSQFISSRFSDL